MRDLDILSIIMLFGAFQGLFIAIIIVQIKKTNRSANLIIALLLLIASLGIGGAFLLKSGYYHYVPYLTRLNEPLRFLIAPLIFLYVVALTSQQYRFKTKELIHFIPFLINVIFLIPYYLKSNNEKIEFIDKMLINTTAKNIFFYERIAWILVVIHIIVYIYFIRKRLKLHQEQIKQSFSTIDKINLSWVKFVINLILIFCLAVFILQIAVFFNQSLERFFNIIPFFITVIILGYIYKALTQPEVFKDFPALYAKVPGKSMQNEEILPKKYEKSRLTIQEADTIYRRLLDYMNQEKPFLNPELSLPRLAKILNVRYQYLSQVINDKTGNNFYYFVNGYRVNEVKTYLKDSEKVKRYNLIDIALEAGFNSKATFNAVFKQITGFTPSQYKKTIGKEVTH